MPRKKRRLSGNHVSPSQSRSRPRARQPDFEVIEEGNEDCADMLRIVNGNLLSNRHLLEETQQTLVNILRSVEALEPPMDENKGRECIRAVLSRYIRHCFKTTDKLTNLLEGTKKETRDTIWSSRAAELQQLKRCDQKMQQNMRNYMLQRLHNRHCRLVPALVLFVRRLGGMYVSVGRCGCCYYCPVGTAYTCFVVLCLKLDLWHDMCDGIRDSQGNRLEQVLAV